MQLSRQAILNAAFEILDAYGFPDMTMRRVATQLKVAPGALYWHVANKQELISAIAEEIVADLTTADSDVTPSEMSELFRECLLRHRDGAEVVTASMSQPHSPVHSLIQDSFLRSITAQGVAAEEDTQAAAYGLVHLTLGSVLIEQSRKQFVEDTGETSTEADNVEPASAVSLSRRSVELFLAGLQHS